MPFGTYQGDVNEALKNAVRFVKEACAEADEIVEGGERRLEVIARLTERNSRDGPRGTNAAVGARDGRIPCAVGKPSEPRSNCCATRALWKRRSVSRLCWKAFRANWLRRLQKASAIPTIGIGAGPDCDGQILVLHDLLGLTFQEPPKFARRYANVGEVISQAVREYARTWQAGAFPSGCGVLYTLRARSRAENRFRVAR